MEYIAEIKEKGREHILKPSLTCDTAKTKEELIEFWGLNEPDVEWYEVYEVYADGTRKIVRQNNHLTE